MLFVGIDWSSRFDDICILDGAGTVIKQFRVSIDTDGFQSVTDTLDALEPDKTKILVGIETDRNILADFLMSAGYTLYNLNPLCVSRFKERYRTSPKKDDRFDAKMIALMLLKDGDAFSPVRRSSPECIELKTHCETIEFLVHQRTGLINRLRADLSLFFPAFVSFFGRFDTSVPMEILRVFPAPCHFKGLTLDEFLSRIRHIRHLPGKRAVKIYESLSADAGFRHCSSFESALAVRVSVLAEQVLAINDQIREIEKKIRILQLAHPLSAVFASVPGAGPRIAPRLLGLFGDNPDRFKSYQQVQCFAGTAPVTEQSGSSFYSVKMRRACSKPFRNALYQLSFCSLRLEPWAAEFYTAQRKKGQTHSRSIRALSNKWVKILFAMQRDRTPYDSNTFTNKRNKGRAA